MFFIFLLILTATSLAGVAAYFSVYGLAQLFKGMFWSVVIMGASLEAGKLIGASYLYRYWNHINWLLKTYLISGVLALMLLTSVGIFGMLSSGYQMEALPLKQLQQQLPNYEQERERLLERKQQIDTQIASLPKDYVKGRVKLMEGFKTEQTQVTARIVELDAKILEIKTKTIETEAHIGPITYIASAFNLDTDGAAKYLIYIIIFAFDPMAVALTLAVNIALKVRREEKEKENQKKISSDNSMSPPSSFKPEDAQQVSLHPDQIEPYRHNATKQYVESQLQEQFNDQVAQQELNYKNITLTDGSKLEHITENTDTAENVDTVENTDTAENVDTVENTDTTENVGTSDHSKVEKSPKVKQLISDTQTNHDSGIYKFGIPRVENKLSQLLNHYNALSSKQQANMPLTAIEKQEMAEIRQILQRHGYDIYLS